jgi:hypothetical protein
MIDAPAFAVTADLLALIADPKGATERHAQLAELIARAAAVKSTFAAARLDLDQHQAAARSDLAKRHSAVADLRSMVERNEGRFEESEALLLKDEKRWAGCGLPKDAPYRQTVRLN